MTCVICSKPIGDDENDILEDLRHHHGRSGHKGEEAHGKCAKQCPDCLSIVGIETDICTVYGWGFAPVSPLRVGLMAAIDLLKKESEQWARLYRPKKAGTMLEAAMHLELRAIELGILPKCDS